MFNIFLLIYFGFIFFNFIYSSSFYLYAWLMFFKKARCSTKEKINTFKKYFLNHSENNSFIHFCVDNNLYFEYYHIIFFSIMSFTIWIALLFTYVYNLIKFKIRLNIKDKILNLYLKNSQTERDIIEILDDDN